MLVATFASVALCAQAPSKDEERVANIKKHAERCAEAQLKMEFEKFIPYVPTKLLEFMGGKDGLKNTITQGTEEMKRRGITIDSVTIGAPAEPQRYDDLLAGLVPQEMTMTTPQGKLVTASHLIAISEDEGVTWVFVDAGAINDQKLGILYPALKGKIKIPAMETNVAE